MEAKSWHRKNSYSPQQVQLVSLDVTDTEQCQSVIGELLDVHTKIDVLINNAGCTDDVCFKKMTRKQWDSVIDTNLGSLYNVTKPLFSSMCNHKYGRIINISSINALKGQFCQVNYAAAKAGMLGFTKALAYEGARYQVTVNAIAPGYTQTPMLEKIPNNVLESIQDGIPLKRMGTPDEIAAAAVFLASTSAGYITGETISINGGLYMK
ncbi:3-oxoacyl-ACP reductase [Dryocola sp. LX212]